MKIVAPLLAFYVMLCLHPLWSTAAAILFLLVALSAINLRMWFDDNLPGPEPT